MNLYSRIEDAIAHQTNVQRTIGQFVLANHSELDSFTIGQIAKATFTSKPSVTRFAKSLGYSGWREFIRDFMAEEHVQHGATHAIDVNFPFSAGATDEEVLRTLGDLKANALTRTYEQLDRRMLRQAVDLLCAARSIMVFGLNPNGYLGELFRSKLVAIGRLADVARIGEFTTRARSLTSEDCAVIVSYSGNNPHADPMRVVPLLSTRSVPTIALTSSGSNYLSRMIACTLTIPSQERLYTKIGNFATETAFSYVLDALYACCFARNYHDNLARRVELLREVEDERSAVLSAIRE